MIVGALDNDINKLDKELSNFAFHQNSTGIVDLTIGKQYTVYGIRKNKMGVFYWVITDIDSDELPWWMPAKFFKVVDDKIPPGWKMDSWEGYGNESMTANPVSFDKTNAIEDGDPEGYEAFQVMKHEVDMMYDQK
jgi:hypothetical protein